MQTPNAVAEDIIKIIYDIYYGQDKEAIQFRVNYDYGTKHGLSEWWDENGKLLFRKNYKYGIKVPDSKGKPLYTI